MSSFDSRSRGQVAGEFWGPPSPDAARPLPESVAAHRHSTLRFWLAVAGAVEAGHLIAIAGAWTPGRAALAAVALGLGASAALAAVILMGTTRPIGRWLGAGMSLVLVASFLMPMAAESMADPTQARIPDLALSVTCTVSPDTQSTTANVDFSWQRRDLWPAGVTGSSGSDSMTIYAELPEWISAELDMVTPDGYPPPLINATFMDPGPWSASMAPDSQTLDGRPTGEFLTTSAGAASVVLVGPQIGGGSQYAAVGIRNSTLQVGGQYELTWTFARNSDYAPETSSAAMLPVFVVEYQHLTRFTVQAISSCADRSRKWPNRSAAWQQY